MITYLIKSGGCLLVLLTVYHLLLEKEKSLLFNRAWLLISLLFSFAIPFLSLSLDWLPASKIPALPYFSLPVTVQGPAITHAIGITAHAMPEGVSWVIILYGLITAFWFLRFSRNLYLVLHRIACHPRVPLEGARLVLLNENYVPHTFGHAIFLNKKAWCEGTIDKEILTHELAHARQLHTLDILLLEVLRIFFWFNPILILYKRAMQLNHEFLADEAVIETYHDPKQYQQLLFQLVALTNPSSLSSPLNYHITKKRLTMITRNAPKNGWAKKLMTVPLLVGVIIIFGTSTHAQKTAPKTDSVVYIDRMITGTENLGANPYVLIDNKPYPSDILTRINPTCIAATAIWGDSKLAEQKYGAVAADGVVIITLNKHGLTYATAIQKENLALKRAAKNGFYYRVKQKHDDGTPYDEFVVNMPNGQATMEGKPDGNVAFVVEDKLYKEGQLDEVQSRLKTMKIGVSGVGKVPKPVPGVDLSRYDVVFFFYSALTN